VLERYIRSIEGDGTAERVEDEVPDRAQALLDAVALGLRLREGLSSSDFQQRYRADLDDLLGDEGRWLIEAGILELVPHSPIRGEPVEPPTGGMRLRVAAEHQFILNEVLARLAEPIQAYARRETSNSHSSTKYTRAGSRGEAAVSASNARL
jgi:coproporphyrinogen III oxidase-like Fe-S oxidoreductase